MFFLLPSSLLTGTVKVHAIGSLAINWLSLWLTAFFVLAELDKSWFQRLEPRKGHFWETRNIIQWDHCRPYRINICSVVSTWRRVSVLMFWVLLMFWDFHSDTQVISNAKVEKYWLVILSNTDTQWKLYCTDMTTMDLHWVPLVTSSVTTSTHYEVRWVVSLHLFTRCKGTKCFSSQIPRPLLTTTVGVEVGTHVGRHERSRHVNFMFVANLTLISNG